MKKVYHNLYAPSTKILSLCEKFVIKSIGDRLVLLMVKKAKYKTTVLL